jgi:hypothetical protein
MKRGQMTRLANIRVKKLKDQGQMLHCTRSKQRKETILLSQVERMRETVEQTKLPLPIRYKIHLNLERELKTRAIYIGAKGFGHLKADGKNCQRFGRKV